MSILGIKRVDVTLDCGTVWTFPKGGKLSQLQRIELLIWLSQFITVAFLWKKHFEDAVNSLKAALRIIKFKKAHR